MTGKLIPFPGQPINPDTAPRRLNKDGVEEPMVACEKNMHIFEEVPGRCQCGQRLWTELTDDQDGPEFGIVNPA